MDDNERLLEFINLVKQIIGETRALEVQLLIASSQITATSALLPNPKQYRSLTQAISECRQILAALDD